LLGSGALLINYGTVLGGESGGNHFGGAGVIMSGNGTLRNYGDVTGGNEAPALTLQNGGVVVNRGTLTGGLGASDGLDAAGGLKLLNTGVVMGGYGPYGEAGDGADISGFGSVKNTGVISGSAGDHDYAGTGPVGIYLEGGTLYNSGTIAGGKDTYGVVRDPLGDAVQFGTLAATLIVAPGAVFVGNVVAPGTTLDVIELTGTRADIGTLSGLGTDFIGFDTLDVDAGAFWAISGKILRLDNEGEVDILSGTSLTVTGAVDEVSNGIFLLSGDSTLQIAALRGSATQMDFLGTSDHLIIGNPSEFGQHIGLPNFAGPLLEDFSVGDSIDLKQIGSVGLSLHYNSVSGVLQVSSSGEGVVASLQFQTSNRGPGNFGITSDGATGSIVTLSG
jgi:hypothetical protein